MGICSGEAWFQSAVVLSDADSDSGKPMEILRLPLRMTEKLRLGRQGMSEFPWCFKAGFQR